MAEQIYRENGWYPTSGLSRVIGVLLFILLVLFFVWLAILAFTPIENCLERCTWFSKTFLKCECRNIGLPDAPTDALTECDRQFRNGSFSLPGETAHERYLADNLGDNFSVSKGHYVLVTLRKRTSSYPGASDPATVLGSVAVEVHRPNDADTLYSFDAGCSRPVPEATTAEADSGGVTEVRWRMYCDLSRVQAGPQEQATGLLKYRVLIKNWSSEPVDYCFVAACDARYPAGEACNFPYEGSAYPSAAAPFGGGGAGQ